MSIINTSNKLYKSNPLNEAAALKKELDLFRPLSSEAESRIMQKFRLDWNYHSNKLEGNSYTYGETKMLLLYGLTAGGKPIKDYKEISGHNEAINYVVDVVKDKTPLTEMFIRHLHQLILVEPYYTNAQTADGQPTKKLVKVGEYKTEPNHVETITGEIFYFAEPFETPAKMRELIEWYREKKDESETNPIVLAAEFHYRFILIHPFDDGNGRIARLLMNFILMQNGYPPVIIKTEDKENYIAVLRQADVGILAPFIEYVAKNLIHSLEIMIRGAKGESIEEPDDLDKELALLEQQFNNLGKKVTVTRSAEAIRKVLETSISKLVDAFIKVGRKFDRFYITKRFQLALNDKFVLGEYDNTIHYAKMEMDKKPQLLPANVRLVYSYEDFTQANLGHGFYNSEIRINFNNTDYEVVDVKEPNKPIRKLYDEELTELEINTLLSAIAERQKEAIITIVANSNNN